MLLSKLLPCLLATFVAAAPSEDVKDIPVAPIVTLYRELGWSGDKFEVRNLNTCVKVTGPLHGHVASGQTYGPLPIVCTLYPDANCTAPHIELFTNTNSPKNFASPTSRSVYCTYR
ncbi:hypothetical protein V8C42DRAFT_345905 [Trichoderma barbatum]